MKTLNEAEVALILAKNCVRDNTILEDLHIQGKINNAEMMQFNIEVVNNIYTMILALKVGLKPEPLLGASLIPRDWNAPQKNQFFFDAMTGKQFDIATGKK